MDLATLLALTVMFWAGYFSRIYWQRRAERRERPYRFVCEEPGCYFKASSNEAGILVAVQQGHLGEHVAEKNKIEMRRKINSCSYMMPDGTRCAQESCAAIHMTKDGHDFTQTK